MRSDAIKHRQMLISAASEVFSRHGAEAPLEAVLSEAGLGRGTLYRHFRNRSELAIAVLEAPLLELKAFVQSHSEPRHLLRDFLGRHHQLAVVHHGCGILAMDPSVADLFKDLIQRADFSYEHVVDRGIASGLMDPAVTTEKLRLATRMIFGAAQTALEDEREQAVADAIDLVCTGLLKR